MYSIIIAGGGGTRLWPLSTPERPKPLLELPNGKTLLINTLDRARKLSVLSDIYLVITRSIEKAIIEALPPDFPKQNIISEPEGKNTAPCIALAAETVAKRDPQAVMGVFPADHYFRNEGHFLDCLTRAKNLARDHNKLVILGLTPQKPSSEYGHIILGQQMDHEMIPAYEGKSFIEKPALDVATQFVSDEAALWNGGIYVGKASVFLEETHKHLPDVYDGINRYSNDPEQLAKAYAAFPSISIDYAITQKLSSFIALKTQIDRIDIGNFNSFQQIWDKDEQSNAHQGPVTALNSSDNIIYSPNKQVALIGVQDFIVINTPDTLLICPRDQISEIRKIHPLPPSSPKRT